MKKVLFMAACAAAFSSCAEDSSPIEGGTGKTNEVTIVDRYALTKSYQVPVDGDGTVSQAVLHRANGETEVLATTDIPLTIQIPSWVQNEPVKRSGGASDQDYIEIVKYAKGTIDFEANSYVKDGSSVLMFEDSRVGDFDYNDLVLYVKHSITGNNVSSAAKITICVKPVALGSANKIAFGWEDGNGEHMLSENVREDFFFGEEGFINTEANKPLYEAIPVVWGGGNEEHDGYTIVKDYTTMEHYKSNTTRTPENYPIVGGYFKYDPVPTTCSSSSNDTKMIKYFIKTSGFKFYVSSIDKAAPEGTFPYGLAIPVAAYHAFERTNFWEAYPDFKSWIETGSPVNWSGNRVKTNCYEKHVNYARW